MGRDPRTSVVDDTQRAHDVPNLWLAGGGSFVTASWANPTLTIVALALRTADALVVAA
jgi:choline dehydrogenase-like flavoprotein